MKKIYPYLFIAAAFALSSCVTIRKYEDVADSYEKMSQDFDSTQMKMKALQDSNDYLRLQNLTLTANDSLLDALNRQFEAREQGFRDQQDKLNAKKNDLEKLNAQLLAEREKAAAELEKLRKTISDALVGFKDKGMDVEVKNGKVYVSMASKLMFASGSWTISQDGLKALRTLSGILEDNPDINVMVEGHTDTDPYRISDNAATVQDNWDLSVMRATAIVKQLLAYGPRINPTHVIASGHSEYDPKATNSTLEGKALNRRTEIILTPKLNDLYKLIEQK